MQFASKIVNELYEILKKDILDLRLKPGDSISENFISSEYGVSRTPVHSTFIRLKGDRLVDVFPQRGTFISRIDMDFANQIIYMRNKTETAVCMEAVQNFNEDFRREIDRSLRDQREILDDEHSSGPEFHRVSDEFHGLFYKYTGKQKLWECLNTLQNDYIRLRSMLYSSREQCEHSFEEHQLIGEMMKAGNIRGLEKFIPYHLEHLMDLEASSEHKEWFLH